LEVPTGEAIKYEVKHSSSLIQCPSEVEIGEVTDIADLTDKLNSLRLELKPIGSGLYPDRIQMTSAYDVRIIDVEISARELSRIFSLDFRTHARQCTTQNIPLLNASDVAVTVKATVRRGEAFCAAADIEALRIFLDSLV
jgi:hypothetical protein